MLFDYTRRFGSKDHTYGYLTGNDIFVFIKVGLGGNCFGDEDRYLRIANNLRNQFGCSVICASNPNDGAKSHVQIDIQSINEYISSSKVTPRELLFFGNSNGCVKGFELTAAGINFSKMLLVNMPLMINPHKTRRFISSIPQTKIIAVYGENDPSFSFIPFFEGKFCNLKFKTIRGADHNFTGKSDAFISLPNFLFECPTDY